MGTRLPIIILLLFAQLPAWSQKDKERSARVEILNADEWAYDDRIPGAQRLRGNVRFRHADAIMHCDSAYLYEDQRVLAFGRVRIDQGDTLNLECDVLTYSGKERLASLQGNVRMRDKDMELTTPTLEYDLRGKRAWYTEGGTIVDRSSANVLTSQRGTYHSDVRTFNFSRNVRLEHPERSIRSDTMHYATGSGVASFFGPTRIRQFSDSSLITTTRGTYDTRQERARFLRRSSIATQGRLLEGDSMHYNRNSGEGRAWGNVLLTDTAAALRASGEKGRYNEKTARAMITGRAVLEMVMDNDTLFVHGDTLFLAQRTIVGTSNDSTVRTVNVRRQVRFYKSDLQGTCDTLTYDEGDQLISMYDLPVLWSGADQITGEHIRIALRDGKPDSLFVEEQAFVLSEVDSTHYDQVAGTTITGLFGEDGLRRLLVEGNSRTVYHVRETKNDVEELVGVNRADCSRMIVNMADGGISTVTFLDRPEAILYPMDKVPPEELRMKGADWRGAERPVDANDIFRR